MRVPPALIQPMAADDVAAAVCEISQRPPANGVVEIAGPEEFRFDEFIRRGLEAKGDPRTVVTDPKARYFGALLQERTLVAGYGRPPRRDPFRRLAGPADGGVGRCPL